MREASETCHIPLLKTFLGLWVSEAGIAISDMSIFSISLLSINTLALCWFHLVQKEEYSNHIGYATYFEYSFSNLHLPY